jgi:hypothetical protein
MRLKKILLGVVVILILILSIALFSVQQKEVQKQNETQTTVAPEEKGEIVQLLEQVKEECINANLLSGEASCIAVIENNITFCRNSVNYSTCTYLFHYFNALLKNDADACANIENSEMKTICQAHSKQDSLLCKELTNSESADLCRKLIGDCTELSGESKDVCLLQHSIRNRKNNCNQIENERIRNECSAFLNLDSKLCISARVKSCEQEFKQKIEALQ